MLINEAADVVDLIVNDHVQILLGGVRRNLGESELLRHLFFYSLRRRFRACSIFEKI